MKPIKLIINYSYSAWNGKGYTDHKRSTILTFEKESEITNKVIEDCCFLIQEKPISILEIQKI